MDVPADFTGTQLMVPHPVNGVLYLKLRDDPETVQTLGLAVQPALPNSSTAATRASEPRQSEQQSVQTPPPPKTEQ